MVWSGDLSISSNRMVSWLPSMSSSVSVWETGAEKVWCFWEGVADFRSRDCSLDPSSMSSSDFSMSGSSTVQGNRENSVCHWNTRENLLVWILWVFFNSLGSLQLNQTFTILRFSYSWQWRSKLRSKKKSCLVVLDRPTRCLRPTHFFYFFYFFIFF